MPALTYVYGASLAIGGIFAYQGQWKIGISSKGALGWGLLFGSLLCWSGLQMKARGPGVRGYPFVIALIVSSLILALSAKKFMDTGKTAMGLVAAASFAMSMRYVSHFTIYGDLYEYGI